MTQFIYFKEVQSHFGFLHLVEAEKDGFAIPESYFNLDKNSLLHRWSQVDEILSTVDNYQVSDANHLEKAMNELKQMTPEVQECPHFQFLEVQLDYLLTPSNKINYTKYLVILARELLYLSSNIQDVKKYKSNYPSKGEINSRFDVPQFSERTAAFV